MAFARPEIIRPPSEWRSYYLPLTSGCSNNTCTFCNYYGTRLQVRPLAEVKEEIDALYQFLRLGIVRSDMPPIVYAVARGWDGKRVFLQDANALVYPQRLLVEALAYLNGRFPDLERVGTYATAGDILRRTPSELKELKALKVGIFYLGLESGDDDTLAAVGKGYTSHQMIEAARLTKEAGILLSVMVILGLAGKRNSPRHALATANVLSAMDPDFVGALTLTLIPGTPLYEQAQRGEFEPLDPFQTLAELKIIIENSRFTRCFFSSMHASNYFSVRGWLPAERDKMLKALDYVLSSRNPALLRPEYARGL